MIVVFTAIRKWWHARQRRIDMDVLWPQCLAGANNLAHAKVAFAIHCAHDPAWTSEMNHDEIMDFVERLEAYD